MLFDLQIVDYWVFWFLWIIAMIVVAARACRTRARFLLYNSPYIFQNLFTSAICQSLLSAHNAIRSETQISGIPFLPISRSFKQAKTQLCGLLSSLHLPGRLHLHGRLHIQDRLHLQDLLTNKCRRIRQRSTKNSQTRHSIRYRCAKIVWQQSKLQPRSIKSTGHRPVIDKTCSKYTSDRPDRTHRLVDSTCSMPSNCMQIAPAITELECTWRITVCSTMTNSKMTNNSEIQLRRSRICCACASRRLAEEAHWPLRFSESLGNLMECIWSELSVVAQASAFAQVRPAHQMSARWTAAGHQHHSHRQQ